MSNPEAIREERTSRRRQRRLLRASFFSAPLPDTEFVSTYRITKELFEVLCQQLIPILPRKKSSHAIDPVTKILIALNFYGRGGYQCAVGHTPEAAMSQQSVSRCLRQVTAALNAPSMTARHIRFPQNLSEREILKNKFQVKYGMPGIIGCIDCLHVAIVKPGMKIERFLNSKNYHSLNVQFIMDTDLEILNVDASYGGATNDDYIWNHHEIRRHLEELSQQGEHVYLFGDSAYPLRPYMITPIENAYENTPEARFNEAHNSILHVIERTFEALKGRWRCLISTRELHYDPDTAGKIAIACSVLHNMCIRAGLEIPPLNEGEAQEEVRRQFADVLLREATTAVFSEGRTIRSSLVSMFE